MTTRTITKLYDSYDDAADTVRDLEAAGIAHDDISLMANNADNRYVTADTRRARPARVPERAPPSAP